MIRTARTSSQASSNVTMQTVGVGGRGRFLGSPSPRPSPRGRGRDGAGSKAPLLESRLATLRVKGEALQTTTDVEGSGSIAAVQIETRRYRWGQAGYRHAAGDRCPTC